MGNAGHHESRGQRVDSRGCHWILREARLPACAKLRTIHESARIKMADHETIQMAHSPEMAS